MDVDILDIGIHSNNVFGRFCVVSYKEPNVYMRLYGVDVSIMTLNCQHLDHLNLKLI